MLKENQIITTNYLIKQLPSSIAFINKKHEILHASNCWMDTFPIDKIAALKGSFFMPFSDCERQLKKILKNCFSGTSDTITIHRETEESKKEKYYKIACQPWYDEKENIVGAIVQAEDVTLSIAAEAKLEKLEILIRVKSEIGLVGSWEYDIESGLITWCDMTRKIHGVSDDFVPDLENGINFYKEGHSRNTISMAVHQATQNGVPWSENLQIIGASGKEKWVVTAGKPIIKNKKVVRLIGTFQDISEQVEAHFKSKENEHLLQTLVDNLPLNVYIKDKESRKILVNKAECDYLGVSDSSQLVGKNDFDLYDKDIAQISRDEDLGVMNNLVPIMAKETISIKKDGTSTTFLTSKIPLKDNQDGVYGLVGISLDITNLKQKEQELRNLINVTSLQNKKLINFAHIVSHNLRSHTANFSMLLDFLVHENDEEEKNKILSMLTDASDNLLETLENLNEVVEISTNVNLEKCEVNLNKNIFKVEQNLQGFLANNNAKIINEVSDDVNIKVVPTYLESILMNFITNAVKYSEIGRSPIIKLQAKKEKKFTILTIADNGTGIDLNKYGDKLFGMYKTFHTNRDSRGIGLYITKNQIEAMHGKVTVESKIGKGTKFKIYFNDKD